MDEIQIVPLTADLVPQTVEFLNANSMAGESDPIKSAQTLLEKNPGLSQLAVTAEGKVTGCIFASFDGYLGRIFKLVVDIDYRQQGLGPKLVSAAEAALIGAGADEMGINCKKFLANWYAKQGFKEQDSVFYIKSLKERADSALTCD